VSLHSSASVRPAAALIAVRAKLLQGRRHHPSWATVDARLAECLRARFAADPPQLRRIDTQTAPFILDQIVHYEAVHAISGVPDLWRRLQADRRCYALFSAALPDQPLVFMELAFTRGLSGDVSEVLDTDSPVIDPATCDCALFYSISSCHDGLRGIPFGNALIRQVVERLQQELPWLRAFGTVSPVPGFRTWLADLARRRDGPLVDILRILDEGQWGWPPDTSDRLEATVLPLCATYLLDAKRGAEPLDAVARFHLGNGARLERLNWLGDRSADGFARSAGITANYLYDLPSVDTNRDAYQATHAVIAAPQIEARARDAQRHLDDEVDSARHAGRA